MSMNTKKNISIVLLVLALLLWLLRKMNVLYIPCLLYTSPSPRD